MYSALETLQTKAHQVIGRETDFDQRLIEFELANEKVGAHWAVPCFALAKVRQQSPNELANGVAEALKLVDEFERVEVAGGYVNLWIKPSVLAETLATDVAAAKERQIPYGANDDHKDKAAVVDMAGLNLAKPFSIGHLRPTNQGWADAQLLKSQGYTVTTDNHVGDWGTSFGMWVVGYEDWGQNRPIEELSIYDLNDLYVQFREAHKAQADENGQSPLLTRAKAWLGQLEAGDEQAKHFHETFIGISTQHMHSVFDRLRVKPDENLGESFYFERGKRMIAELVELGIAIRQDDNSVIVPLDEYGIDVPILLEKGDGASLYTTSDMVTTIHRMETWHPNLLVYAVAAEQQFHFKQVFALAQKLQAAGYIKDALPEMVHAWFGFIEQRNDDGSRSKMSSRKGTVLLEELLDQAEERARQAFPDSDLSDEDIATIAVGAVKFTDFAQARQINVLFDWERMFSLGGFSGPYVQYAAVRVGSVMERSDQQPGELGGAEYDWAAESNLIWRLLHYPGIVKRAADEYEPYLVAQYVYELGRLLNQYYEQTKIIGSEAEPQRLALLQLTRGVFEHGLSLLGIQVPTRM